MTKPFVRLSLVLKLLWVVVLTTVAALLVQGFLVDAGVITLGDMMLSAGTSVASLIGAYLAIEFIGVARGFIEDDVGAPPSTDSGSRQPSIMTRIHLAARHRQS